MKISISIPAPCNEPWKDMSPAPGTKAGKGRYCAQCDHVVADLTRATDAELVVLFTSDARPKCARFDPAQLDRALGDVAEQRSSHTLPIAAFSSLLALASGHEALAQKGAPMPKVGEVSISVPAPPPPHVMGKMMAVPHSIPPTIDSTHITGDTVVVPMDVPLGVSGPRITCVIPPEEVPAIDPPPMLEVCGRVVDESTGEVLPFVAVGLRNTPHGVTTDINGNFTLKVPQREARDLLVLELRYVGYETRTQEVILTGDLPEPIEPPVDLTLVPMSPTADPKDPRGVQGRLMDRTTGTPLSDVLIGLKGSDVRVRCDDQGNYFLHVPEALGDGPITVEFTRHGQATQVVVLSRNALPACIAHGFIPSPVPAAPPPAGSACHTVGTINMIPRREAMTVGMMVVQRAEERPTAVQRITGPMIRTWRRLMH